MTNLSLTYSFWWIFICLLIGGVYAWVQYSKTPPWSAQINYGLSGLRVLLVSVLCFLFLEPHITKIKNQFQLPLFVIAVDNSTSVIANQEGYKSNLLEELGKVDALLKKQGFDVAILNLDGNEVDVIDSIKFNRNTTDLSKQLIGIKNNYYNANVAGIALFSDGIFNQGYSPFSIPTKYPIYTIGLGDTTSVRDLAVTKVVNNATVFDGNSLMLEVHAQNTGFSNINTELKVWSKNKLLKKQRIEFSKGQVLNKVLISVPVKGKGKQSLKVEVVPKDGEFTAVNNSQMIYVDVIDAQKKILLLASSPHPDIKAIKASIEKNEYYNVEVGYELPTQLNYDLIIAHQYPASHTSLNDKNRFAASNTAKWLLVGGSNDINYLKNAVGFNLPGNDISRSDLVKPLVNINFDKFKISDGFLPWVADLPPISTPYGIIVDDPRKEIFLKQQIGRVATELPLLFFTKDKEASLGVLLGVNVWKWKLDEYRLTESTTHFDEMISKTVQYLSRDKSKSRFYAAPQKNVFKKGEEILFDTQEYDALFEQITGHKVTLELTGENGFSPKYSYVPLSENYVFKIRNLPQGVYNYAASVVIEGKIYKKSGQFVVKLLDLEVLNPTADFDLLRKMASKSNGDFYTFDDLTNFKSRIKELEPISIIHTTQKEESIFNLIWVLGILLLMASMEWFLRKFYGGY